MAFKQLIRVLFLAGLVLAANFVARAAEPVTIVGFGDSLMAGYQLPSGDAFPSKLQAALRGRGHQVSVINAGVSGDTTSGGRARLDWSVPDAADLVVLELGANDALRGIPPQLTEANLEAMVARLKQRGIKIVLVGMLAPPNMGSDYEQAFNAIFPRLAEKYQLPFYRFFLDGVAATPALLLSDGMHPNPQGIDKMVAGILPLIETVLKSGS